MFVSRIASAEFQHWLGTRTVNLLDLRISQPAPSIITQLLRQTSVGIRQVGNASQVVTTNIVNFPLPALFYVSYRGRIGIAVDIKQRFRIIRPVLVIQIVLRLGNRTALRNSHFLPVPTCAIQEHSRVTSLGQRSRTHQRIVGHLLQTLLCRIVLFNTITTGIIVSKQVADTCRSRSRYSIAFALMRIA